MQSRRKPTRRGAAPQPPFGPPVELTVEFVGARGDGVAAGPVFVPFTLPGERVRAKLAGERGELVQVLDASPERVAPVSPHYGECGGCSLQHWAHGPYLAWKRERVRLALARERIETEILAPFAAPPGSRRRLALHARPGTADEARIGFKARGGWRLVEVRVCPIADPRLQAAFAGLRRLAAPLFEHPRSAPTLHATWTETGLDVDITGVERRSGGLSADARSRVAEAAQALDAARVTLAGEPLFQQRRPTVRFGKAIVAPPPGGFLQAVPEAEAAMAAFVVEALQSAMRVADLFSGAGAFSFRLAGTASVHAVDGAPEAVAALKAAAATPGLKPVTTEARDLFRQPLGPPELKRFDGVVFDPPRAGAATQARAFAASSLARVVGVSCNPTTFARDARILIDGGFRLERVLPVDQFLWSPHVELVGVFTR